MNRKIEIIETESNYWIVREGDKQATDMCWDEAIVMVLSLLMRGGNGHDGQALQPRFTMKTRDEFIVGEFCRIEKNDADSPEEKWNYLAKRMAEFDSARPDAEKREASNVG